MRSGSGFLAVMLLLVFTSCSYASLWGQSREDVLRALEAREYGFLDGVSPRQYDRILRIGDGAPYYVGLHLALAGRESDARAMFAVGTEKSKEPFRRLCMKELTRIGAAEERLESVKILIRELSSLIEKDSAAVYELENLNNLSMQLELETGLFDKNSADIRLWFYSRPMTSSLAALVSSLPEGLPGEFYGIAATRASVFRREYGSAWLAASRILETGVDGAFYRPVLSDFCKAALYGTAGGAEEAAFLDRLRASGHFVKSDERAAPFMLAFYSGRLYAHAAVASDAGKVSGGEKKDPRKGVKGAGQEESLTLHALARERLQEAIRLSGTDTDHDSAIWYLLEDAASLNREAFFVELAQCAPIWKNPAFFTDLLDAEIVKLVSARDNASIVGLYRILREYADSETVARLGYLAARTGRIGADEANAAYRSAFTGDHGSLYYRVMSAEALGIPVADSGDLYATRKTAGLSAIDSDEAKDFLEGFIEYHLPEKLYSSAKGRYDSLPVSLASDLAEKLEKEGYPGEAVRLMLFALRSSDGKVTDADLARIYPRPWLPEVTAAAKRFGLSEYLVYAMIRSESLFSADATSGAGAQGLTQLMRPTAADIASRLKYETYDLGDPATNITFGAYYLSEMIRRMDGRVLPALFAYNAGISRVRAWQKAGAGLENDFFLESLPYGETREYGRKVLAAAAVYGYLYYHKSPGQIVRELF